jgi:hypothetical protein
MEQARPQALTHPGAAGVSPRRPGTLSLPPGLADRESGHLKVMLLLIQSQAFLQAFFFFAFFRLVNNVTYCPFTVFSPPDRGIFSRDIPDLAKK